MLTETYIDLRLGKIDQYTEMLLRKEPFSLSRYGDGEWMSILGFPGKNCDGVEFTSELQAALTETLVYPHLGEGYHYGMLAIALRFMRPHIEKFTRVNNLSIPWVEATFLVKANRHGNLRTFLNALRVRPTLYIGPPHLAKLHSVLGLPITHFIEIPEQNAFAHREDIRNKVLVYADEADLIGFSAGPATKWLIWSLFSELGETHTMFDFGSIFDGYVGRPSRKYQKRSTWTEIAKKNIA